MDVVRQKSLHVSGIRSYKPSRNLPTDIPKRQENHVLDSISQNVKPLYDYILKREEKKEKEREDVIFLLDS